MAESTTTGLIRAPRPTVYRTVSDVQALAACLQPQGTVARLLGFDPGTKSLRMEIAHGPGPADTRRFHLAMLEQQKDQLVVYGAAFETDDPLLAGEMKLHFILADAPGGTRITVRHEGIPARIDVRDNERGTASSLENLARLIEGREE